MSDSTKNLVGGYTFVHEGEDYNLLIGRNQIYPNVVEYVYNNSYILVCQKLNKELYKKLYKADLSSDYRIYNAYLKDSISEKYMKPRDEILADSIISKIFKNKKISFENTIEDIKKSEEIADSIIKNNPTQKKIHSLDKIYWIIKIHNDVMFGPFSKQEYLLKKKSLNIDKNLNLIM